MLSRVARPPAAHSLLRQGFNTLPHFHGGPFLAPLCTLPLLHLSRARLP